MPQRLIAAFLLLSLSSCGYWVVTNHPPFHLEVSKEAAQRCQQILAAGIFHSRSLACSPLLRQEVEKALCSVDVGEVWLPFAAGFGVGAENVTTTFPERTALELQRAPVDATAWNHWRAEHCGDAEPVTDIEADWGVGYKQPEATQVAHRMARIFERTQDAFALARAVAPPSLVEPWERCALSRRQVDLGGKPGVHCRLIASSEPETLYFSALRIFHPDATDPLLLPIPLPRYFAPKLRRDLEIQGATCEGPAWRKGMRLQGHHTLRCQRQDSSEVTFRLVTSKGDCTETLPATDEPTWQESCPEVDREPPAPDLPFRWPPTPWRTPGETRIPAVRGPGSS